MRHLSLMAALLLVSVPAHPRPSSGPRVPGRRLILVPDGTAARYRVREQLASVSFPSDAVGTTDAVTGTIVLDDDGRVVPAESRITVDLTTLKSDRERRDRYIQGRTLETERFPTALLVPAALRGAPVPLPASGSFTFALIGDLTVHGVTQSTTWQVSAEAKDGGFAGTATTHVKFADFGLTQPRVAIVLSVEDDIGLELDFHFRPDPGGR